MNSFKAHTNIVTNINHKRFDTLRHMSVNLFMLDSASIKTFLLLDTIYENKVVINKKKIELNLESKISFDELNFEKLKN